MILDLHEGDIVQVKVGLCQNKTGKIIPDSPSCTFTPDGRYKVEYEPGWVGWHTRDNLRIIKRFYVVKKSAKKLPPPKPSKRAIKQARALPGMEGHLNRLKAAWHNPKPSDEVLERWIKYRVTKMIYTKLLNTYSLFELLELQERLSQDEGIL